MSLNRALTILSIALAVQLAVVAALRWQGNRSAETRLLVPALGGSPVDRIVLGGASNDDSTLTIEKKNDLWVLSGLEDYPADARAIEALLRTLLVLRAEGPVVTSEQYHDSFEIREGNARGRLRLFASGAETPLADLVFGSSSPSGASYVRDSGQENVYEVLGLAAWDVRSDPAPWLEQPFVDLEIEDVTALRVERDGGGFTIRRTDSGWVVDDGRRTRDADPTKIADTLRVLASLAPVAPAGKTGGSLPDNSSPILSIRCELGDGAATLVQFGTSGSEARVTIASSARAHAAEVWKSAVEPLLRLTADEASID